MFKLHHQAHKPKFRLFRSINQSLNESTTSNNTLQENLMDEQSWTFTLMNFCTLIVGKNFKDMIITSDSENNDDSSDEEIEI